MRHLQELTLTRSEIYSIGRVAFHWSYLEFAAEHLIWSLLRTKTHVGRAVTEETQLRARLKIIQKLFDAMPQLASISADLPQLIKEIKALEPDRNLIIHGTWKRDNRIGHPAVTALRRSSKSRGHVHGEYFPPERFQKIVDGIIGAGRRLILISGAVDRALASSDDKS
ncbi:hypothetical protein V5279_21215 [Bradyrhizobium sp. 26S5]|uniref:hypothetical protein n=1 Tax=Bradyrhizobium sp. 26S5 TaxID=3139729 RepID=UPI0030D31974